MTKLVETADAIFDEYRLQIIKLLQTREMCVCELAAVLNLSSSRISQHLAVLRRVKIVRERREGKWIFYSLIPKTVEEFSRTWSQFVENPMESLPEMKNIVKRLEKMDLTDVKQKCAAKKVAVIHKLKKEGTNDGN